MKTTALYVYALTNDSGFAPCIKDGKLTLACCKGGKRGGMRKAAAMDFQNKFEVWILGLCGKSLAGNDPQKEYKPVYLARINNVYRMQEYFSNEKNKNRSDYKAYTVIDGRLVSTKDNPHKTEDEHEKDIGGGYVLCSDEFVYWGNKCGSSGLEIEKRFPYIFHSDIEGTGKCGIDKHFRGYMVDRNFPEFSDAVQEWTWFPQKGCNIISDCSISGEYIHNEDENNDDEIVAMFSCGGCRR